MATRRDETGSVKKTKEKSAPAARKAVRARKAAPRKKPAAQQADTTKDAATDATTDATSAKGLLRAGLKALGNVRDDVVKHQTNVIESLLGIAKPADAAGGKGAASRGFGLDIGLRKFEDVFDQRVAAAMQRLGLPTAQDIHELREQMRQLIERIDRLERTDTPARRKR